jgi:tetratricopeptide (TPR) repeat protein
MFWKKKDKSDGGADEATTTLPPAKAAAPPAAAAPAPSPPAPAPQAAAPPPAPPPVAPPPIAPPPIAPPPVAAPPVAAAQSAPAAPTSVAAVTPVPGGDDLVSRVAAWLDANVAAGMPRAAVDSSLKRARAREIEKMVADPSTRAFAERILAGDAAATFEAMESAGAADPSKLRMLGSIAFEVDPVRARRVLEAAKDAGATDFWTGVFLARLRGRAGQIDAARQAAQMALAAAGDDVERFHARTELCLIAFATNNALAARGHAVESVAAARGALTLKPGPEAERDLIGRLSLLGDAYLANSEASEARGVFQEALELAGKHADQGPDDLLMQRIRVELLGKLSPTAFRLGDSAQALQFADSAAALARSLVGRREGVQELRDAAGAFANLGDLKRALKDQDGAYAAWREALAALRRVVELRPKERGLQREMWTFMWRLATENTPGVGWAEVAHEIESAAQHAPLEPADQNVLAEAKRRASA